MQIGEIGFRGGTHGAFVVSVVGSDVIIETWRAPVIAGFVASIVGIGLAILGAGLRFSYRRARANPLRTVDPGLRPALYVVAGLVALSGALAIIGGATLIVHDEEGRGRRQRRDHGSLLEAQRDTPKARMDEVLGGVEDLRTAVGQVVPIRTG